MANIKKLVGDESRLELGQKINGIIDHSANVSLSNLDEIGEARFSDLATEISTNAVNISKKANTTDIDGQWVAKLVTLADDVTLSNSNSTIYSLADYLPNDGNIYEVIISMAGNFGGLGHYNINTGYNTLLGICGKSAVSYCITMPISAARELRFYPTGSCSGTNKLGIRVTAYRKVR